MVGQQVDFVTAVPSLVAAADAYRAAVEQHNAATDEATRALNNTMAAVVAAVNNARALGLDVGEGPEYRNADDMARVLDTLKVILRQVSLSAII